jgi:L-malate glycosyltransferase
MITVIHVDTERTWRGGERQVFELATRLPQSEFRSVIAAPPKSPLIEKAAAAGLAVQPLAGRGEISPMLVYSLMQGVKRFNADIFHVHSSHGLIGAAIVRAITSHRMKVIYSRRTDFRLKTTFLGISRKKYVLGTDIIVCVSEAIRQILLADGLTQDQVTTVYSGIDLTRFVPHSHREKIRTDLDVKPGQTVVGMVAALAPHKDPLNFVSAARIIADRFPEAVFWIVGTGTMWDDVQALISSSSLDHRVRMLGFRSDIPELLSGMDIFCISSREEGLCTSILDAMAMELPVVATRAGGIPEAVDHGKTGLLVSVQDPGQLASALGELIADAAKAKQFGAAGRNRVKEIFLIESTVRKTAEIYRAILSRCDSERKGIPSSGDCRQNPSDG